MPVSRTPLSRATLLLIDDDPVLSSAMQEWLQGEGYGVELATTGRAALARLEAVQPDLILLDLNLPDVDGLVLCGVLKERSRAPIIICSATARRRDAILGFRLGADDFVAKPFDFDDLEARMQAILRRTAPQPAPPAPPEAQVYQVGELVLYRHRHQATLGAVNLPLTPGEYRLLSALAAHPDVGQSRADLAQAAWGYQDILAGRAIDVHIRRLRVKLQAAGASAPSIVSLRGVGYMLATPRAQAA